MDRVAPATGQGGEGHACEQSAQAVQVPCPGLMVDAAHRQKQRRLVQGVDHQKRGGRSQRQHGLSPGKQGQHPQGHQGGVGQNPLEITGA
jgi:hypothetical protein